MASREGADLNHAAFGTSKPNIARVYDYWLGGKDNFAADRAEAERMLEIYPPMAQLARENRLFLARAVSWLAAQGIRQFLDVGSGLPTAQNTHQIAQGADPSCRVVYADNDPVVLTHARALLTRSGAEVIDADLTDPAAFLSDPAIARLIWLGEPTGLILACVVHFFDAEAAQKIMTVLIDWLAPGSYVVLSVGSGDKQTGGALAREYQASTLYNHSPEQITGFFAGLDLIDPPGLVDARNWNPGMLVTPPLADQGGHILVGVGRKAPGLLT